MTDEILNNRTRLYLHVEIEADNKFYNSPLLSNDPYE
jgi:hypothetical protein